MLLPTVKEIPLADAMYGPSMPVPNPDKTEMMKSSPVKGKTIDFAAVEAGANADQKRAKARGGRKTSGGTRYVAGRKAGSKK